MNTKYNIGDKVLIEVTVKEIHIEDRGVKYYVVLPEGSVTTIKEENIYGQSESEFSIKETSFEEYLNEQMKDPEFKKEYDKLEKESKKKVFINDDLRNELRKAICRTSDDACTISKVLGLPANYLTNIILGHTKKIAYERFNWICVALNIKKEL